MLYTFDMWLLSEEDEFLSSESENDDESEYIIDNGNEE
jgi:hypothetical protein